MENVFTIQNLNILPEALKILSIGEIKHAVEMHQKGEYTAVSDTVFESQFHSNQGMFHLVTDFDKEESIIGFLNENPGNVLIGKKVYLREAAYTDSGKKIPARTACSILKYEMHEKVLLLHAYVDGEFQLFFVEWTNQAIHIPMKRNEQCEVCGDEYVFEESADPMDEPQLHICDSCQTDGSHLLRHALSVQKGA